LDSGFPSDNVNEPTDSDFLDGKHVALVAHMACFFKGQLQVVNGSSEVVIRL
jgi:hypothetical protein